VKRGYWEPRVVSSRAALKALGAEGVGEQVGYAGDQRAAMGVGHDHFDLGASSMRTCRQMPHGGQASLVSATMAMRLNDRAPSETAL